MNDETNSEDRSPAPKSNDWSEVVRWSIIGVAAAVILLFVIVKFAKSFLPAEPAPTTKTYGIADHDVQFDKNNITEAEVDKIADALTRTTFFDREKQKFVDIKKFEGGYELNVYCNETIKEPGALTWFVKFRDDMQKLFPSDKIVINLVIGTPDNLFKRLE